MENIHITFSSKSYLLLGVVRVYLGELLGIFWNLIDKLLLNIFKTIK